MEQRSIETRPHFSPDPIADAYRDDTRRLMAHRIPMAAALFLVVIAAASGFEWRYHPERLGAILLAFSAYLLVSVVQIIVVRRQAAWSVVVTEWVVNWLALGLSTYFGIVHSSAEALLVSLVLLMNGVAVLYPWGLRGQLTASVGTVVGYPLALALGATPGLPVPYEVFVLATAAGVAGLGASVLDRQRLATFQHEKFSAALVDVGRALDATISDPRALAEQLTEHTRRVLGADWAILHEKDLDEPIFRATAVSGAPSTVAQEVRALEFSPRNAPDFYRLLDTEGIVERIPQPDDGLLSSGFLRRWEVSALVLQAIRREREVIGVLGCCYTTRRRPLDERERQLIAAIANQAGVALDNARLMEATRRANRLKSDFMATLSHELRTPLSVISGYTDLLLDGEFDALSDAQLPVVQRIREQSGQLTELIQAMLDLNRLETRRLPLTVNAFTIGDLMDGIRNNLPASWGKQAVAVRWDIRGGREVLRSDRGKLEMILRNLIHNALKYTDAGSVTIVAEPHPGEGRVVFTVADTGPGIATEDQSVIFEMFRQGSTNLPRGGGVGLGLYIVKRFTEALGGGVSLESREGVGARFTVWLPLDAPSATVA